MSLLERMGKVNTSAPKTEEKKRGTLQKNGREERT